MAESRLQLSMDYGTKNLSVAYRIVEDGVEQYQRPDEIEFDSGKNYAPQQIAWISDDLFYWGWVSPRSTLRDDNTKLSPGC